MQDVVKRFAFFLSITSNIKFDLKVCKTTRLVIAIMRFVCYNIIYCKKESDNEKIY